MIFIDFDGTIVDVWKRYFSLVADFFVLPPNMFQVYQTLKKSIPDDRKLLSQMLKLNSHQIDDYLEFKHRNLESSQYLNLDSLLINADALKTQFDLYQFNVLTIRKNKEELFCQYQALGLEFLKPKTIVLDPKGSDSKLKWLKINTSSTDKIMIVGDSETDMMSGELASCQTVFVNSGLRSLESISEVAQPNFVYQDINEFFKCLPNIFPLER